MLGLRNFLFFFFWKEGRKSTELLFTSFCLNRALCVNPPPHNETLYSELAKWVLIQDHSSPWHGLMHTWQIYISETEE